MLDTYILQLTNRLIWIFYFSKYRHHVAAVIVVVVRIVPLILHTLTSVALVSFFDSRTFCTVPGILLSVPVRAVFVLSQTLGRLLLLGFILITSKPFTPKLLQMLIFEGHFGVAECRKRSLFWPADLGNEGLALNGQNEFRKVIRSALGEWLTLKASKLAGCISLGKERRGCFLT